MVPWQLPTDRVTHSAAAQGGIHPTLLPGGQLFTPSPSPTHTPLAHTHTRTRSHTLAHIRPPADRERAREGIGRVDDETLGVLE